MANEIEIRVTQANLDNGVLRFSKNEDFFPNDAWGGSNKSKQGKSITVIFAGTSEEVQTDLDGKKKIMRNARGQFDRFYKLYKYQPGDPVYVSRQESRTYKVSTKTRETDIDSSEVNKEESETFTNRKSVTISRIIRDTDASNRVKELYANCCQVCGTSIPTAKGYYSEGAHIKPLGEPHNGPDLESNILCLCPNHHVMLDRGSLLINDDLSLTGAKGRLKVNGAHKIDIAFIRYNSSIDHS